MKIQMILCGVIVLLGVTSGTAQSSTDIRKIDFKNFSYQSSLCSKEYGRRGIGPLVRVRNGEFKNKSVYFTVADDKIVFADVTGDGTDDAVVPANCGAMGANFDLSEVFIYSIQNGRAALLSSIGDKGMQRDYRRNYPDAESYWGVNENGIKTNSGNVQIEVLADGPHASPKYIVTLEYHLKGKTLSLVGKPTRKSSSP